MHFAQSFCRAHTHMRGYPVLPHVRAHDCCSLRFPLPVWRPLFSDCSDRACDLNSRQQAMASGDGDGAIAGTIARMASNQPVSARGVLGHACSAVLKRVLGGWWPPSQPSPNDLSFHRFARRPRAMVSDRSAPHARAIARCARSRLAWLSPGSPASARHARSASAAG